MLPCSCTRNEKTILQSVLVRNMVPSQCALSVVEYDLSDSTASSPSALRYSLTAHTWLTPLNGLLSALAQEQRRLSKSNME
jgi:hypothetical protein